MTEISRGQWMPVPQRRRRCTPRRPHSAHVARASRPSLHVTVSAVEGSRIALQVRRSLARLRLVFRVRSRGSVRLVLLLYLLLDAHRIMDLSRKAYLRQRRNSAGTVPAAPGGPFDGRLTSRGPPVGRGPRCAPRRNRHTRCFRTRPGNRLALWRSDATHVSVPYGHRF